MITVTISDTVYKHEGYKVHEENLTKGYTLINRPTLVPFVSLVVKNF
jgi:hypothetical protein